VRGSSDGRALEIHNLALAGAESILCQASTAQKRQVLGCEVALVNPKLMDDPSQLGVVRFELGDGRRKISRRRRT
jgi:hypothetical protein